MTDFYFDKVTVDDLCEKPKRFDTEQDGYAKLYTPSSIATLYPNGPDDKPISLFRHMTTDFVRFAGIIEPGDSPLDYQKGLHIHDLAGKGTPINAYAKLSDDPVMYGFSSRSEELFCEYHYYEDKITWKEGNN